MRKTLTLLLVALARTYKQAKNIDIGLKISINHFNKTVYRAFTIPRTLMCKPSYWMPVLLFFILLAPVINSYSQPSPIIYPYNSPKSPNASSFERFLAIPTDLHSGQVNYSVPLYNASFGEIEIPIALEYQNSGLKVADLPSWVGLGWNLMVGGAITRSVRGLPDDCATGILNTYQKTVLNQAFTNQLSGSERYQYFREIVEGNTDSEHDVFYYEFCGHRGSFFINNNGGCEQLPKGNDKFIFTRDVSGLLNSFEITDTRGIKYLFNIREDAITDADNSIYSNSYYNSKTGSTWYLTKITSPSGRVVNLEYNQYQIIYRNNVESRSISQSGEIVPGCGVGNALQSAGMTIYTPAYQLKKISWDFGKIDFIPGADRTDMKDLDAQNNIPFLSKIQVSNAASVLIKEIGLNMVRQPRLMLRNVYFNNISDGSISSKYEFNYNQESYMPSCNRTLQSFNGQDYWGYYNGVSQNTLLAYNLLPYYMTNIEAFSTYISADRNVNSNMAAVGMLKEIIYPTGGKTTFEYESNKVLYKEFDDVPLLLRPIVAAQATYTSLFGGQATTNGTIITNSDASGSFTVSSPIQGARIRTLEIITDPTGFASTSAAIASYPIGYVPTPQSGECTSIVTTTTTPSYEYRHTSECLKPLPIGTYTTTVQASSYDGYMANALLTIEKLTYPSNIIVNVGGIRIKKITSYGGDNQVADVKEYEYPLNNNNVTDNAILKDVPLFISSVKRNVLIYPNPSEGSGLPYCLDWQS